MRAIAASIPFAMVTMLCWGVYGPVLRTGSAKLGGGHWLPFIGVGMAYVVIAILVPAAILMTKGDSGKWTTSGAIWSLAAGCCGAVGALGIISAFEFNGSPLYVMPLVFGSAPVVNTLVSMWMTKTFGEAGPVFFAGIALVALGAAGVFAFAPKASKPAPSATAAEAPADGGAHTGGHDAAHAGGHGDGAAETYLGAAGQTVAVFLSIALTGLCWGSYGSVLHKGTHLLGDSRLRALLCVGISYFFIAVLVPVGILSTSSHELNFSMLGMGWAMLAGAAGAFGALGLILAFNFGGKPVFVMPLVFGGAPVVNTFVKMWSDNLWDKIGPFFFVSLGLVIAGAVTVLVFAPKPRKKPGGKKTDDQKAEPAASKETPETPAVKEDEAAVRQAVAKAKIKDADKIPDHDDDPLPGDPPPRD